jgi:hypothetical protein
MVVSVFTAALAPRATDGALGFICVVAAACVAATVVVLMVSALRWRRPDHRDGRR